MNLNAIEIRKCDITKLECDAIVNAANKTLLGGGGVDGAIHRAAGKKLLEECRTLNGCETGEAKITAGYDLPAKHVIHTVGPIYSGVRDDIVLLGNCYINSLDLARKNDIHSIAFPAISTGVYGYPAYEACTVAIHSIEYWLHNNSDYDISIIMSCFDQRMKDTYDKAIKDMKQTNEFMKVAIEEAMRGIYHRDGGPFGCVIVKDGSIIARNHNRVLADHDPSAHGEIMAIRDAGKALGTHDLSGCELYTTGEPCSMCISAIVWANIEKVYYGCSIEDNSIIGFRDGKLEKMLLKNRLYFPVKMEQIDRDECLQVFYDYVRTSHKLY
ncbi:MAG: O-acetyl-ADP-ribose deacetylase [Erysipelotrichaceae bacterium]|nr:O-acetyl-ADP-ribose deacetylase [Erysipelotrichaceae bacterium]